MPLHATWFERFEQWWQNGRTRLDGHESFERDLCRETFSAGWNDALAGRSDFVRRSLSHATGERSAYMTGRFLAAAQRSRARTRDERMAS